MQLLRAKAATAFSAS